MAFSRLIVVAGAVIVMVFASGCSGGDGGTVFEAVSVEPRACPAGVGPEQVCLRVTATVAGDETGTGTCRLHAAGDAGNLSVAAESGELRLVPGQPVTWDVDVEPPGAAFREWNPECSPMIEG